MGFLEALFGALEPVQHIASSSSSGLASSFGFVFQPPYQPGYKVIELPGNKLSLGAGRPYVLHSSAVHFPYAICCPGPQNRLSAQTALACHGHAIQPRTEYRIDVLLPSVRATQGAPLPVGPRLTLEYITRCCFSGAGARCQRQTRCA